MLKSLEIAIVGTKAGYNYYKEASEFKKRIQTEYKLTDLTGENSQDENGNRIEELGKYKIFDFGDSSGTSIEDPNSNFNQQRLAVIKYSIEKNLSIAIANYNTYASETKVDFQMPKLKEDEWEKISNNVSIISFLQGLSIGGKIYNGYSIINNNKNNEVVNEDSIYIVTTDNKYHRANDKDLVDQTTELGVLNIDFEIKSGTKSDGSTIDFMPKSNGSLPYVGCYSSIVDTDGINETDNMYKYMENIKEGNPSSQIPTQYFSALGRERYSMYRTNNNNNNNNTHNEDKVRVDTNGGSSLVGKLIITEGNVSKITNEEPKRDGYTFKGWSTDKNATEPTYAPGEKYNGNENITLYAVWWKNIEFTITGDFTTNGDNLLTGVKFLNNEMYTTKKAVLKTNAMPKCKIENIKFYASPSGWISITNNGESKLNVPKSDNVKISNITDGNFEIELTSNKVNSPTTYPFVFLQIEGIEGVDDKFYQPIIKK